MLPEPWPTDDSMSAALLARIIRSIDHRDVDADDDLLTSLLWSAWPNVTAQDQ